MRYKGAEIEIRKNDFSGLWSASFTAPSGEEYSTSAWASEERDIVRYVKRIVDVTLEEGELECVTE